MTGILPLIGGAIGLAILAISIVPMAGAELDALAAQPLPDVPATPRTPPAASDPGSISVFNYNKIDNACRAWGDGCRNCTRESGDGGGILACSNIGIACQPGEVTCARRDLK